MTNLPAEVESLTFKQRAFIHHFLHTLDAKEAALLAGYSPLSAKQIGHKNMTNATIRNAIEASFSDEIMRPNEIMARLSMQARGNIGDVIDDYGNVDINKARELRAAHLVKSCTNEITTTEDKWVDGKLISEGKRIEKQGVSMYDAGRALIQLARIYALFNDRVTVEHRDPVKEQAIEDIKSGVIVYGALADVVGPTEAAELFRLAGKAEAIPASAGAVSDDADQDANALPAPSDNT